MHTQAQSRKRSVQEKGRSGAPWVGLGRALTADDVSAPPELRAALLQVSQGVEHLHSLRIVHRFVWRAMAYMRPRVGGGGGNSRSGVDPPRESCLQSAARFWRGGASFALLGRLASTRSYILYVLFFSTLAVLNRTERPVAWSWSCVPQGLHASLIFYASSSVYMYNMVDVLFTYIFSMSSPACLYVCRTTTIAFAQ